MIYDYYYLFILENLMVIDSFMITDKVLESLYFLSIN